MGSQTASLLPPPLRDQRGLAFAAALDSSIDIDPWLACPLALPHAPDEVLWELARQFGVAGPLWQAMPTRQHKERLVSRALRLHRHRGTPWVIEELMRLLGYTDAYVLDRANALLYNAEADHDGQHIFAPAWTDIFYSLYYDGEAIHNGAKKFSPAAESLWSDYRIRLDIAADSRPLAAAERVQAASLAESWAPLRAKFGGWYARHLIRTPSSNPQFDAAKIARVTIYDDQANEQTIENIWAHQLAPSSAATPRLFASARGWAIRWRLSRAELRVPHIARAALIQQGGIPLDTQPLPRIDRAKDAFYEGFWLLEAQ